MKKYITTLSLSLVLMTMSFFIGYFFSKMMYDKSSVLSGETDITVNTNERTDSTVIIDSSEVYEPENKPYYLIKTENTSLNMYKIESDGRKILITAYTLSEQLLPSQDRYLLQEGIEVDTQEEAFEIIENFIS